MLLASMATAKFKQVIDQMYEQFGEQFADFKIVHDRYTLDRRTHQAEYNKLGAPIMEILRDSERRLCSGTEKGGYGQYSAKLADRYWEEIKKTFPLIDFVGVKIL